MTTPEATSKTPRRFSRRTTVVSLGVVVLLIGSGISLGFANTAQEQERTAQAAADEAAELRRATAEARTDLAARYLSGQGLAANVAGLIAASAPLINDGAPTFGTQWAARATALTDAITATADAGVPDDAGLPVLRMSIKTIDGQMADVRSSLDMLITAELAAAGGKMANATRADKALWDAVPTAQAELVDADLEKADIAGSGVVERFAALSAAVAAAEQSHAAVLAAEAAAAAAAAQAAADAAARANSGNGRKSGGGSSSGGGRASGGGGSSSGGGGGGGSSTGGGSAGGGAVGGGATGGGSAAPGAAPAPSGGYTNDDARAAVVNKTGAVPKYGRCVKANYGTWGKTSSPPPPVNSGVLGYEAGALADGSGGWVTYYSCE